MFLDSFRVLTERFADDESWMTPLEALGALHISKIGLHTEAPELVQHSTAHTRRLSVQADFADV